MTTDLVVLWVDGNDPAWQAEKAKYVPTDAGADARKIRYRDWDTFRYFFRGVERCLPWINRVYLVTWGHLPAWLDPACPKLRVVRHDEFIPAEYLPTFSANPIELNVHRLPGLSERFIFANDDTFFLRPLPETFFFRDGLPVDAAIQNVQQFREPGGVDHIVVNDLMCLNRSFDKRAVMRSAPKKWFAPVYGRGTAQNLYLLPFQNFTGFADPHLPNAFLRKSFEAVWAAHGDTLGETCRHRVRSFADVNQWLIRYWQFAAGTFAPGSPDRGRLFAIGRDDRAIEDALKNRRCPMVCLSDHDETVDFEAENRFLTALFEELFPTPSAFEKRKEPV